MASYSTWFSNQLWSPAQPSLTPTAARRLDDAAKAGDRPPVSVAGSLRTSSRPSSSKRGRASTGSSPSSAPSGSSSIKLDFMADPSFETPGVEAEFLAPLPEPADRQGPRSEPPEGLPPYLASLYDVPLLSREQEAHLFRKMNYLKFRVNSSARGSTRPRPSRRARRDRTAPGGGPGGQEPDHPRQPPPGRLDRQEARRAGEQLLRAGLRRQHVA